MLRLSDVAAVLVTRGDVDLQPIRERLPFEEVYVWDNVTHPNLKVYGRYAGIHMVSKPVIYVQDDDCVVPTDSVLRLVELYEEGVVACNMTEAHRAMYASLPVALVGWGAIFDRFLPDKAFNRYGQHYTNDDLFKRECDRVFTGLTPKKIVTLPFEHLPHAHARTKMGYDASHHSDFQEILARLPQC